MQKITSSEALGNSIRMLERRQIEEGKLLMDQFSFTYEHMKPINILRRMISEIASPPELKDNLIQTSVALIVGYFTRKVLIKSSRNPLRRITVASVQYLTTNFVSKNSATINMAALYLIDQLEGKLSKLKR